MDDQKYSMPSEEMGNSDYLNYAQELIKLGYMPGWKVEDLAKKIQEVSNKGLEYNK